VSDERPLPNKPKCHYPRNDGDPCRQPNGLRWVGKVVMCGQHATKAERDARKSTGKSQRIVPRNPQTGQDLRGCSETTKKGAPCQIKQGLQLLGGEVLCPTHRRKRRVDSRGVGRNTPLRHESQCTICQNPRRAEIEQGFVDGVLAAKQLAQHLGTSEWAIYRHMKYFGLDDRRALNTLPYLGHIMREGALQTPTARDAVAAALAAHKITHGMRAQLDARMEILEKKTAEALVAVLDRLGLEPIAYKRAGVLLEQEVNRRFFGEVTGEDLDTWDLEDDPKAPTDDETQH